MRRARAWVAQAWDLMGADLPLFALAGFITVAASLLTAGLLSLPLLAGLCIMFLEKASHGQPSLAHLWEGFAHLPAALVIWVVYMLGCLPFDAIHTYALARGVPGWGALSVLLGHCLVSAPLLLCVPLIADRDVGGLEALRISWARTRSAPVALLALAAMLTLLLLLGLVACGVGLAITAPLAAGATVMAYRDLGADPAAPAPATPPEP
jgi:uncharacterized membrane protein